MMPNGGELGVCRVYKLPKLKLRADGCDAKPLSKYSGLNGKTMVEEG
jgi:hypothetical protein